MNEVVRIPFLDGEVLAVEQGGKKLVALRPIVDDLGLDYSTQHRKLRNASWARMVIIPMRLPDQDRSRDHSFVELGTLGTWLVGVGESKVAPEIRPLLIEMQAKLADHIERFFTGQGPASTLVAPTPILPQSAEQWLSAGPELLKAFVIQTERVAELQPKAQLHDDWLDDNEVISLAEAAKDLAQAGLLPAVSSHYHLCELLTAEKWVTKPGGRYSPAPWTLREDTVYLTTRWPKSGPVWTDPKTGRQRHRRATIFLTRAGLAELYRLLVLRRDYPYGVVRAITGEAEFQPIELVERLPQVRSDR
jgi:hypothetical protein